MAIDLPAPSRLAEPAREFSLRTVAARLTPNPALTVDGTLEIILDGIDKIDEEDLARALGRISARMAGLDAPRLSDEDWAVADPQTKGLLLRNAAAMKLALREMV